jgi:hypothetical protein
LIFPASVANSIYVAAQDVIVQPITRFKRSCTLQLMLDADPIDMLASCRQLLGTAADICLLF